MRVDGTQALSRQGDSSRSCIRAPARSPTTERFTRGWSEPSSFDDTCEVSTPMGVMPSTLRFLQRADELGQLDIVHVGDRPKRRAIAAPLVDIKTADESGPCRGRIHACRPDEYVDGVRVPLIDQR